MKSKPDNFCCVTPSHKLRSNRKVGLCNFFSRQLTSAINPLLSSNNQISCRHMEAQKQ